MIVSLGAVTALGNFQCPRDTFKHCTYKSIITYSYYNCRGINGSSNVSVSVEPNHIEIQCYTGMGQSWPDLIDGVNASHSCVHNATDVFKSLAIMNCPVPENKSVAEILGNLSVKLIEKLSLKQPQGFNNVLTNRYLKNLNFVHNLKIEGDDITPFPKKILDDMPNLGFIELPKHVMSTVRLEVLKVEAEKRRSNSTHNNTRTDSTIIEKLFEFSELNITNHDVNILVGRTSSPNLESVNLTNNNITFLLFENLPNLTQISLTNNRISSLHEGTFSNLTKLKQISVDHNEMSHLESSTFKDLRSLLNVSLSENNLTYLPSYLFKDCPNLTILDVSKNKLTALNETSLHGLEGLKTLFLQDNQLMKIKG